MGNICVRFCCCGFNFKGTDLHGGCCGYTVDLQGQVEIGPNYKGAPGRASEEPGPASTHSKFTKVTDSLFELYNPGEGPQLPSLVIIFFHGLQLRDYEEAYYKTWSTGDECWPVTWLKTAYPGARILSVSYDSCARKSGKQGRKTLKTLGQVLYEDVVNSEAARVCRGESPILLVGHSLGGIVIKQLIKEVSDRYGDLAHNADDKKLPEYRRNTNFCKNLSGVAFYSTPHRGSDLAKFVKDNFTFTGLVGEMLKELAKDNEYIGELTDFFSTWRKGKLPQCRTLVILENRSTSSGGVARLVVPANTGKVDQDSFCYANADHFTVCKPQLETDNSFVRLKQFINDYIMKDRPETQLIPTYNGIS